jgi:hypothetical protein
VCVHPGSVKAVLVAGAPHIWSSVYLRERGRGGVHFKQPTFPFSRLQAAPPSFCFCYLQRAATWLVALLLGHSRILMAAWRVCAYLDALERAVYLYGPPLMKP